MVAVRTSRVVGEVIRKVSSWSGATRQVVEVGGTSGHASSQAARCSRVVGQVMARTPKTRSVTRVSVEVGATSGHASSQAVQATALNGQVLSRNPHTAAATRQSIEVGATSGHLSAQPARTSRFVGQVISRLRATPVVPLPLPANLDVFFHNWAQQIKMSTTYQTDVTTSPVTASEERRGLVPRPKRALSLKWTKNQTTELDRILVFLRRMTEERLSVPLYQDHTDLLADLTNVTVVVPMDTTKGRFHTGGRVVLAEVDYALHFTGTKYFRRIVAMQDDHIEIDAPIGVSIQANAGGRSWQIMPMIDVEKQLAVEGRFKNGVLMDVELTAEEVLGPSALPPWAADIAPGFPDFRGYPIFNLAPDWSNDVQFGYDHPGEVISTGRSQFVYVAGDRARYALNVRLIGDRALGRTAIKFHDSRLGRLRPWWQLDEEYIWTVLAFNGTGDFIDVAPIGRFADFADRFSFVGLEMADGTRYVREVVNVQDLTTIWRITVDPQLPGSLNPADVVHVARARLVRNTSDSVSEEWVHGELYQSEFSSIEVLDEGQAPIQ